MSKKRTMLALAAITILALAACRPQTVIVERQVKVTQIVTQVVKEMVKETVVVAGTPKVVEKEVTKVVEVEKMVTPTPDPDRVTKGGTVIESTFADAEVLNPVLSVDNSSKRSICTGQRACAIPASERSSCSPKLVFRHPSAASTSTPMSCRAACGNAC